MKLTTAMNCLIPVLTFAGTAMLCADDLSGDMVPWNQGSGPDGNWKSTERVLQAARFRIRSDIESESKTKYHDSDRESSEPGRLTTQSNEPATL
jgi:hypothetical protein